MSTDPAAVLRGRYGMTTILLLGFLAAPLWPPAAARAAPPAASSQGAQPSEYTVLLHAHGALAHGWTSVVDLQNEAARRGIDAVILTEQLVAEWGWAPPVVRRFLTYRRRLPSVSRYGPDRFLTDALETDRKVAQVRLIVGLEAAPYYHWTGAPWRGDLTMWDWQRNLLILGLEGSDAFRGLPALGLASPVRRVLGVLPRLLLAAGLLILIVMLLRRRHRIAAAATGVLVGLVLLAGPPVPGPFDPYADEGVAPWQALIDTVASRGGFTIWSQIESVDDHLYGWGRIHTSPHPEVLETTRGYAGFGAIYASTSSADEPGGAWDRVLTSYVLGRRAQPVWGWGEAALHYPDQVGEGTASKQVDEVLSVVKARDSSADAILDALRNGRGYAVRSTHAGGRLRLGRFEVMTSAGTEGPGGTIWADGPTRITAAWSFTGSGRFVVDARLIRNGRVVATARGEPGGTLAFEEPIPPNLAGVYYRLELEAPDHQLLTNPVFVIRRGKEGTP